MSNSWDTEQSGFDPRKFYPDGKLSKTDSLSGTKTIRISDQVIGIIEKAVGDPQLSSIECTSDAIRDGTIRFAHAYIEFKNDPNSPEARLFASLMAANEIRQTLRYKASVDEQLSSVARELQSATGTYKEHLMDQVKVLAEKCWIPSHVEQANSLLRQHSN